MVKDCHPFRLSAWGAKSDKNAPPVTSDAKGPSMMGPRASGRPPLAVKSLNSATGRKNHGSLEVNLLKTEMVGKERLVKDLEAENEKLRQQLVQTLHITAEERQSHLEKKTNEVQLLERSIEDLEDTIFTLEKLALANKNATKEIPAVPSTGKARTWHHEYGHQNLRNGQESIELEAFLFENEVDEKESENPQLGSAIVTGLLDSMVKEGRWLNVAELLEYVFADHSKKNEVAVTCDPGSWKLQFAHPEMYCLPRRQLALELANQGKLDEARVLAKAVHDVVAWTSQKSNRWHACHLMGMMLFKGQVLLTSLTEAISSKDVARERNCTCTAISDYLHAYLPRASGWLPTAQVATFDDHHQQLIEQTGPSTFRCLLCHETSRSPCIFSHHLETCPAVTPGIKARFPQLRQKDINWHDRQYRKYREKEW